MNPPPTIGSLLADRASRHPDRKALVLPGSTQTYRDLDRASAAVARAMLALGLRSGDRICVWLPNSPEWVAVELGAARIGVVVAPLNLRFKKADASYVIGQLDPVLLFTATRIASTDHLGILATILPELASASAEALRTAHAPSLRKVIAVGESQLSSTTSYPDFLALGTVIADSDLRAAEDRVQPADVVHIQYTSGTTSRPKGAMLTHAALLRNAAETADAMAIGEGDPLFNAAPLYHCGAFVGGLLVGMHSANAFVTLGHFDADLAIELIARERCTIFRGPQTILAEIADHAEQVRADLSSLRGGICGSSTRAARVDLSRRLGMTDMVTIYGISEGATAVTMSRVTDPFPERLDGVGRPLPGLEVRIAKPGTGLPVERGVTGEICFRGWGLMTGYYKQPEETAKAFDTEGWFHSGDLGWLDVDGTLHFAGRLKDVIRVGGENVSAAEVEDWLDRNPHVQMSAVVAAPDERLGECCVAFVRLVEPDAVSAEEIIAYCRGALASFKVPRAVYVLDTFPLTGSGKIMKATLRSWLRDGALSEHTAAPSRGKSTVATPHLLRLQIGRE